MASPYGIDIANVLGTVDAIKTARLSQRESGNAIAGRERERQELEQAKGLRGAAFGGDQAAISQLAAIAPEEAMAFRQHFEALDEKKRAEEIAATREQVEQVGRIAAHVLNSDDPEAAYMQVREHAPPEMAAQFPEKFDPGFVRMQLERTMDLDQLIDQVERREGQAAFGNALATAGQPSPLGNALAQSESGGSFSAQNDAMGAGGQKGHFGRGQFGVARLEDAKRAGVIPSSVSPEVFMANPDMQLRVEQWHKGDILAEAQRNGTYSLIGQQVAGVPVTEQGLINVAHLGGKEGAKRFFESGGQYDPADENGTRLSDYLAMGAQEGGAQQQPAAQPPQPEPLVDPRMAGLMAIYGNPALTDPQRAMVEKLIEFAQGPELTTLSANQTVFDPSTRQPVYTAPAAPESDPASVQEYQFAVGQGEQRPYSQWLIETKKAGATTINMGAKEEAAQEQRETAANVVTQDIARVKQLVATAALPTTGMAGAWLSSVGGTASNDARALLDTIKANIAFDKLQQMRAASPTGGALGAVSDRENQLLQATLGSLEQSQSQEQFLANLTRLETIYDQVINGPAPGAGSSQAPADPAMPAGPAAPPLLDDATLLRKYGIGP